MRMGLHAHTSHHLDMVVRYYRELQPPVFKTLDPNRDLLLAVKAAAPRTKIVFRNYWADQNFDTHRHFREETLHRVWPVRDLVDFVEGYNEFGVKGDPRKAARFADHEVAFAEELLANGLGACVGGFSTGFVDDDPEMFDAIRPMLELCHRYGGDNPRVLFHAHEYAGPYMQYMAETPDGCNQWRDGWTGVSPDSKAYWHPQLEGWLTLRYRKLRQAIVAAGLDRVRFFFSETGIDDVNPRPGGANKRGWRDYHGTEWSQLAGIDSYADQQRWYGWQLSHDPYVFGWCDFGWATQDNDWDSFDLSQDNAMFERFLVEQAKLPDGYHGGEPMTDRLNDLLRQEFGDLYDDERALLDANPDGPNGAFARVDPKKYLGIAIHHSASDSDMTWTQIAEYHVTIREFAGIGYHLGIREGRVSYLGDIDTARAHVKDHNHEWVGICMMGNFMWVEPSDEDMALLRRLVGVVDVYLEHEWPDELPVVGHYQVPDAATACPGKHLKPLVPEIRNDNLPPGDDPDPLPVQAIQDAARLSQTIQPNPDAALQKAIHADGLFPISGEFDVEGFRCQLAARAVRDEEDKKDERIYFAEVDDWSNISWIGRE